MIARGSRNLTRPMASGLLGSKTKLARLFKTGAR